MLNIDIRKLSRPITYRDKILLMGSCFTEHIGNALAEMKFTVLQNPNGILFDPVSVCRSLSSYIHNKKYSANDLFQLNEVWNSWEYHSKFSHIDQKQMLDQINASQQKAHEFLKKADWIVITLGSSFFYQLTTEGTISTRSAAEGVANCHRAPAKWFTKELLEINQIANLLHNCYYELVDFNPKLNIIFTVSPVRHIRDGVVENNRSKARLIEAVHYMADDFERTHYFPAYELVIDVLRDYRFYDIDMVHPNYPATEFVLDKFADFGIDDESRQVMEEVKKIVIARKHKAFQPATNAHRQFLSSHAEKVKALQDKYPFLDLQEELEYFNKGM